MPIPPVAVTQPDLAMRDLRSGGMPSCAAWHAYDSSLPDGVYAISGYGAERFMAYCDMTTDGGGWTAFYAARNGAVNVFDHFEDASVDCPDPQTQCVRRIPQVLLATTTEFQVSCGNDAIKLHVNDSTIRLFQNGNGTAEWQPLSLQTAVRGAPTLSLASQIWTGSQSIDNLQSWAIAGADFSAFASAVAPKQDWGSARDSDTCNGLADTTSPVKLFYREPY